MSSSTTTSRLITASVESQPWAPMSSSSSLSHKREVRVRFDGNVEVRLIKHVDDLSESTRRRCWYSREENMRFQRCILETASQAAKYSGIEASDCTHEDILMYSFCTLPNTDVCARGLEGCIPTVLKRRRRQREKAREAVFRAQFWDESDVNIASAYAEVTSSCISRALVFAEHDEKEAISQDGLLSSYSSSHLKHTQKTGKKNTINVIPQMVEGANSAHGRWRPPLRISPPMMSLSSFLTSRS